MVVLWTAWASQPRALIMGWSARGGESTSRGEGDARNGLRMRVANLLCVSLSPEDWVAHLRMRMASHAAWRHAVCAVCGNRYC